MVQPALERDAYGGERLAGLDVEAVLAAGRTLLEERPRTNAELRRLLGARWPERDPAALAYAVRGLLPIVHVPPRGIWGASGPIALTTVEAWLGRGVNPDRDPDEVVLRFLAAFGPATVEDIRTWSGLTGLRAVIERLQPRLRTFSDERGRELFDVPDAPLPDPDTPAPSRFLPELDNALLSHADRTRIIADDHRRMLAKDRRAIGTVLLDDFVRGAWRTERTGGKVTRMIEPFGALLKKDRDALAKEGGRLLRFMAESGRTPKRSRSNSPRKPDESTGHRSRGGAGSNRLPGRRVSTASISSSTTAFSN